MNKIIPIILAIIVIILIVKLSNDGTFDKVESKLGEVKGNIDSSIKEKNTIKEESNVIEKEKQQEEYMSISLKELSLNIEDYLDKKIKTTGIIEKATADLDRYFDGYLMMVDKEGFFIHIRKDRNIKQIAYEGDKYTIKGIVEFDEGNRFSSSFYYVQADQPLDK